MATQTIQQNMNIIDNIDNNDQIITMVGPEMEQEPRQRNAVDVIIVLDESGSMSSMGDEPWQAINTFIEGQQANCEDGATFSFVTFSNQTRNRIIDEPLKDTKLLSGRDYHPNGMTALNDAVCSTINRVLASNKPNNKVMVIMTDGYENASSKYNSFDTKNRISLVENKHDWKVVFMGANIDAFAEGERMNINQSRCAQYNQLNPGSLLRLCRATTENVSNYRNKRSAGLPADLTLPDMQKRASAPVGKREVKQAKMRELVRPPQSLSPTLCPPPLTRSASEFYRNMGTTSSCLRFGKPSRPKLSRYNKRFHEHTHPH